MSLSSCSLLSCSLKSAKCRSCWTLTYTANPAKRAASAEASNSIQWISTPFSITAPHNIHDKLSPQGTRIRRTARPRRISASIPTRDTHPPRSLLRHEGTGARLCRRLRTLPAHTAIPRTLPCTPSYRNRPRGRTQKARFCRQKTALLGLQKQPTPRGNLRVMPTA